MNGRIQYVAEDGAVTDITEGVQALYDLVIQSMDWGSGFLTVEDALPVVHVAKTCGFAKWEEAERYVTAQAFSEAQGEFMTRLLESRVVVHDGNWVPEHPHVFMDGKCLWRYCKAVEDA